MKTVAVTLLGLSVILALTSTAQAGKGKMMPCKKYMKEPTEEQKTMFKECWGKKAEGADGDEDKAEKMKKFTKMGICILEKTKILVDNKFNIENFNAGIDAGFTDTDKAALLKKETAACVSDASKEYKTDEDQAALLQCIRKAKHTACKDGDEADA